MAPSASPPTLKTTASKFSWTISTPLPPKAARSSNNFDDSEDEHSSHRLVPPAGLPPPPQSQDSTPAPASYQPQRMMTHSNTAINIAIDDRGEQLVKVDLPFSPERNNFVRVGVYQRELPRNVYAAVILVYLNSESTSAGLCRVLQQAIVPLVLTITAQVTLASYLRLGVLGVQGDLAPDCAATTWWLKAVALFAFVGLAVQHIMQIVQMHQWLDMFKSSQQHEYLRLQKYESNHKMRHAVHRPVTGITPVARFAIYALVLLPFFAATCFNLWAGAGAVLRSGNDFDLVLNNVAAIFVLDLDDYAYALLLPQTIRNATEGLPPLNRADKEGAWRANFRAFTINFYSWLLTIVILAIDVPVYYAWCGYGNAGSTF